MEAVRDVRGGAQKADVVFLGALGEGVVQCCGGARAVGAGGGGHVSVERRTHGAVVGAVSADVGVGVHGVAQLVGEVVGRRVGLYDSKRHHEVYCMHSGNGVMMIIIVGADFPKSQK